MAWGVSILLNPLAPAEGNSLSVAALVGRPGSCCSCVDAAALVGLVIAAAAPFLRFRRAGDQQRQQLKWVAFTVAVSVLSVLVTRQATFALLTISRNRRSWALRFRQAM